MNKNKDPRFRLIILILVMLNVVIVREGYLLSEKFYYLLFVSVPVLFYLLFRKDNSNKRNQSINKSAPLSVKNSTE